MRAFSVKFSAHLTWSCNMLDFLISVLFRATLILMFVRHGISLPKCIDFNNFIQYLFLYSIWYE